MDIQNRIKELRYVPARELVPNPRNWRKHPAYQRRALRGMGGRGGFAGAELVRELDDGRLMLIDGHLRADEFNDAVLPVLVTDLDEHEANAVLATYDPLGAMAETDAAMLEGLLTDMAGAFAGLEGLVADVAGSLNMPVPGTGEEPPGDPGAAIDRAEELREKWQVERGDVWQIGRHRLMCGDSTSADDVARLMAGEKAALVVTDPPYGVEYADKNKFLNVISPGNRIQTPISGDHGNKQDIQDMWRRAFEQMNCIMLPGAVVYCFMPQGGDQMMMMMMMMGAGIEPRHELIWLKNNHVLGRVDYAYKHEPILYAWKKGGHKFYGNFQTSVIECKKPQKSDMHPTMKPVELIEILVHNSSREDEAVYDLFTGSGTTLVACEQTGRRGYGMEIEPKYCAVTLERLAGMGLEPVRVGTKNPAGAGFGEGGGA